MLQHLSKFPGSRNGEVDMISDEAFRSPLLITSELMSADPQCVVELMGIYLTRDGAEQWCE